MEGVKGQMLLMRKCRVCGCTEWMGPERADDQLVVVS